MGFFVNKGKSVSLLCVLIVILKSSTATLIGDPEIRLPEGHVALFVLGDSLYDPGNNNYINTTANFQANFWPYGETFFKSPTGRFSNGRLIPDFISEYAKLPLIPPYLEPGLRSYEYGVNFASGGAGALVQSHQGFVVDFQTQLSYLKNVAKQLRHKHGAKRAKKLISSAVYLISIGGNDYLSPFTDDSSYYDKFSKEDYIGMVLGNFTQVIEGIYNVGGRKFGFLTLPPLGCFPGTKSLQSGNNNACFEKATILTNLHNEAFPNVVKQIESRLKGFKYSIHDLHTSMTERMENPKEYGFVEANMGCCGSGKYRGEYSCGGKRGIEEFELCEDVSDYFFFDSVHPTEKAYKQLSELIWSGKPDVTSPYNLKQLFQL